MKGFEIGRSKTGGREKGTPNKPKPLRNWVEEVISNGKEQFLQDMASLEPHERIAIFEKLMQYVLPKLKAIEVKDDGRDRTLSSLIQRVSEYHRQEREQRNMNSNTK